MSAYIAKRLLQGVLVLLLVSILTFFVMYFMPGDPARNMVGQGRVTEVQLEAIRDKWGLNDPWYQRYWSWFSNFVTGDLGISMMRPGVPISEMVADAAQMTLRLNVMSFALAFSIAVPVGILAAVKRYSPFDYLAMMFATLGVAMPNFWVALMAVYFFAVRLEWLPLYGVGDWRSYVLPVAILAFNETASLARLTRAATVEVLGQDFVTTARAKGLAQRVVVLRHVVRNALLPVVTLLGYQVAFILSGTIVIETIFAWPGLGRLFFQAITYQDLQTVQAIVMLLTALVVVMNIVTDLTYAFIDPRVRVQ